MLQNTLPFCVGIIPARYASSRLPGKPLADIEGQSMIWRTYCRAAQSQSLYEVWVATDDERVYNHVMERGGKVVMTAQSHQTGTERCAEAVSLATPHADIIVNIQGDEPFIHPQQIDQVADLLLHTPTAAIATLVQPITDNETLFNPSVPKVVIDQNGNARYFSRQTLPYLRNHPVEEWLNHHIFYKHIGIYGYRASVLQQLPTLPESPTEKAEMLEQLRWLWHGYTIQTAITPYETLAVDTSADLAQAIQYAQQYG